jgi:Co/Zn/Cd efflux system component
LFRAKGQEIQMAHNHGHERDREHAHDHDHGHQHGHDHEPGHGHAHGRFGRLQELIPFLHGHSHGEQPVDAALEGSDRGLWALKVSLLGLGLTAAFQLVIVLISGSVGLLADTIHNASDALTALPLGIAFVLGRRPATRRYTYGYGRAEDVAGVLIVAIIFLSAVVAAYESVHKLLHPQALHNLGWVMVAAIVGSCQQEPRLPQRSLPP